MAELAKLRHMKFDDWRSQRRKEVEWQRAVVEVRQLHLANGQQASENSSGKGAAVQKV